MKEMDSGGSTKNVYRERLPDLSPANTKKKSVQNGEGPIPPNDGTVQMKRQIGLLGGIAITVGSTLGSGIFITPSTLLERTDSVAISLTVWVACGLISTLVALAYCELGTAVPRSGGEHAYLMAAYKPLHKFWGELPAFLFSWIVATLLRPAFLAVLTISFANYIMLPFIGYIRTCGTWKSSFEFELLKKLIASICVFILAFANIQSAKLSSQIQIIFTIAKLLAPLIVISFGIYNLISGEFGALPNHFDTSEKTTVGNIATAFYSGLWAYDGWNNINFLTEELINPKRNLPLAILLAVPFVTIIYLLMNVSYLTVLTKSEMMASTAVGFEFADRKLGVMSFILPLFVAASIFGTANGSLFTAGRLSYVAARDGHLVDVLSYVHVTKLTPSVAILFNCGLSFILIGLGDINSLIDTFAFVSWIIYALAMGALFVLRFKRPELNRPFRVPLIIPALATIISIFMALAPIIQDPGPKYLLPVGFCLVGVLLYYPFVYKKKSLGFMGNITRCVQCVTLAGPSPYKED